MLTISEVSHENTLDGTSDYVPQRGALSDALFQLAKTLCILLNFELVNEETDEEEQHSRGRGTGRPTDEEEVVVEVEEAVVEEVAAAAAAVADHRSHNGPGTSNILLHSSAVVISAWDVRMEHTNLVRMHVLSNPL
ncbi:hypothetical protein C8Q76DRAFT_799198 [Earliella scabrosa]|nr:hypothetical protein C8Q76DRAFT_799198 [Earliella scabrosa]